VFPHGYQADLNGRTFSHWSRERRGITCLHVRTSCVLPPVHAVSGTGKFPITPVLRISTCCVSAPESQRGESPITEQYGKRREVAAKCSRRLQSGNRGGGGFRLAGVVGAARVPGRPCCIGGGEGAALTATPLAEPQRFIGLRQQDVPWCKAFSTTPRSACVKGTRITTSRLQRRCWPTPTSASPKSRTASASHRRRSIGTSRPREPRIRRAFDDGRFTPKTGRSRRVFSLAAGGGSAPIADLPVLAPE
jgi:hypothetical protein